MNAALWNFCLWQNYELWNFETSAYWQNYETLRNTELCSLYLLTEQQPLNFETLKLKFDVNFKKEHRVGYAKKPIDAM